MQLLDEGCLEGTRGGILDKVRYWLQAEFPKNILWISGAPGAGKTTIATTIAKEFANTAPFCVRFPICHREIG